jgi:hypothetical protein
LLHLRFSSIKNNRSAVTLQTVSQFSTGMRCINVTELWTAQLIKKMGFKTVTKWAEKENRSSTLDATMRKKKNS